MSAKHTPGPWRYVERDNLITASGRRRVLHYAIPLSIDYSEEERNANGYLIAAAPEMYAALDAIIESGEVPYCESSPLATAARSALKKARGES